MNKVLCMTALCLGVLVLSTPSTAFAMDPSVAKIPFPFIVGDKVLPAGEYRVSDANGMASVVQIVSADGREEAFAPVEAVSPDESAPGEGTNFKFKKIGNDYYLSSVTVAGEVIFEFVLPKSPSAEASTIPSMREERFLQ